MTEANYHPDPEINAEVAAQALEAERIDLAAGYLPRRWVCECGASHQRGHFMTIGVHRCLRCGYVGDGGIMGDPVRFPNANLATIDAFLDAAAEWLPAAA